MPPAIESLALENYHLFHATRAELLARLTRIEEAQAALERAIALTTNATEVRHLQHRLRALAHLTSS